jgi:hypothetical protein
MADLRAFRHRRYRVAMELLPPHWTIQVDPLTYALGYAHVQVERAVSPSVSVYAGPHLRLYDAVGAAEHEPYIGLGVETGVRWFPQHHAPSGVWLMGRGVLAELFTTDDTHQHAIGGYASALVGYTGIIHERLVLSGGLGVQRLQYTVGGYGLATFYPAAHTAIGVAF